MDNATVRAAVASSVIWDRLHPFANGCVETQMFGGVGLDEVLGDFQIGDNAVGRRRSLQSIRDAAQPQHEDAKINRLVLKFVFG
jgi:hypothetical protein